jgi:hypothetical protein
MGIVRSPENVLGEMADWHAKNRLLAVTPIRLDAVLGMENEAYCLGPSLFPRLVVVNFALVHQTFPLHYSWFCRVLFSPDSLFFILIYALG